MERNLHLGSKDFGLLSFARAFGSPNLKRPCVHGPLEGPDVLIEQPHMQQI